VVPKGHATQPTVRLNERFSQSSVATKPIGKKRQSKKVADAGAKDTDKARKKGRVGAGRGSPSRRRPNRRPARAEAKPIKTTEELDMEIDQYMKEKQTFVSD
jgi:hypothetical protein